VYIYIEREREETHLALEGFDLLAQADEFLVHGLRLVALVGEHVGRLLLLALAPHVLPQIFDGIRLDGLAVRKQQTNRSDATNQGQAAHII
jgi:hypothetical protein